jgi:hypothetical protein
MKDSLYDSDCKFSFGLIVKLKMRYVPIAVVVLIRHSFFFVVRFLGIFEEAQFDVIVHFRPVSVLSVLRQQILQIHINLNKIF